MLKKILFFIGILIVGVILAAYNYYPFTNSGCENLKNKIDQQIKNSRRCDLSSDCQYRFDSSCNFSCVGYFSSKINAGLISRYIRRCNQCRENCYFNSASPACLSHTCETTGGLVNLQTNSNEYLKNEEIKLLVSNNSLNDVKYGFPISLCLRPTIMRLEKYHEETKEWLSSGVGLLFDNDIVKFYENPDDCQVYKINNCTADTANKFIDEKSLIIKQLKNYAIPASVVLSCFAKNSRETTKALQGRYRVSLYYETVKTLIQSKQVYSNEFLVK